MRERISLPILLGVFAALVLSGLAVTPELGLKGYFVDQKVLFDAGNYLRLAREGYTSRELTAFYPLWPMILRSLEHLIGSSFLVLGGQALAASFFVLSVFFFMGTLQRRFSQGLSLFIVFLYMMNPNSFFHVLLYPESASSLFIAVLMYTRSSTAFALPSLRFLTILILSLLCALSRPWLPYFVGASLGAWLIVGLSKQDRSPRKLLALFKEEPLPLICGSVLGYALYGYYTNINFGSFLEPFAAQQAWGRTFALHWSLLLDPKSVGGSDHVLFWDIQAFYLPWVVGTIVGALIILQKMSLLPHWAKSAEVISLQSDYLFWFSLLVVCGLSLTAFLSYPIFMSIGRHIFSTPLIFFCLGSVLNCVNKPKWLKRTLCLYALVSAGFLVMWGTRFSKNSWMG